MKIVKYLIFAFLISAYSFAFAGPPEFSLVTRDEALAAIAQFQSDPIANLNVAPIFLKFIQNDGEVHAVINDKVMFWMFEDHAPNVRAILYAAYMASNAASQLRGDKVGDDYAAGLAGALLAYKQLKNQDGNLTLPVFETLANAQAAGTFEAEVDKIKHGQH